MRMVCRDVMGLVIHKNLYWTLSLLYQARCTPLSVTTDKLSEFHTALRKPATVAVLVTSRTICHSGDVA
jgi:hypothetical protein